MRPIDADELKELRNRYICGEIEFDGDEYDLIDKCPTIDAVPVVRCKDCKYNIGTKKCLNPDSFFIVPKDDDFCSYGKYKNGG